VEKYLKIFSNNSIIFPDFYELKEILILILIQLNFFKNHKKSGKNRKNN